MNFAVSISTVPLECDRCGEKAVVPYAILDYNEGFHEGFEIRYRCLGCGQRYDIH